MSILFNTGKPPVAQLWASYPGKSNPVIMSGTTPGLITLRRVSGQPTSFVISDSPDTAWPLEIGPLLGRNGLVPDWSKIDKIQLFADVSGHVNVAFPLVSENATDIWVVDSGLVVQSAVVSGNEQLAAINAKLDALLNIETPEPLPYPVPPTTDEIAKTVVSKLLAGDEVGGFSGALGVPSELALAKPYQNYQAYAARSGALWALESPEFWVLAVGVIDALVGAADTPEARRTAATAAIAAMRAKLWPQA